MDLKKYYEFFGNTLFGSGSKIEFMKDGSFVVYDRQNAKVTCYDADCSPFYESDRLKDVVVLSATNTVVVRDVKLGGFRIYKKGKEIANFLFSSVGNCFMHTENNSSIVLSMNNNNNYSHVISTACKAGSSFNVTRYINPHNFKEDDYGNIAINSHATNKPVIVIDAEGNEREIEGICRVNFLSGKRAIINRCSGQTELVSYGLDDDNSFTNLVGLLCSEKRNGIMKLGNYAVIFEDKLIASADDGSFLREANSDDDEDEVVITPFAVKLAPYVTELEDIKGFYPASSYQVFDVEDDTLFVFFYNGKFYPILIDLSADYTDEALHSDKIPMEYANIVLQAFPSI